MFMNHHKKSNNTYFTFFFLLNKSFIASYRKKNEKTGNILK